MYSGDLNLQPEIIRRKIKKKAQKEKVYLYIAPFCLCCRWKEIIFIIAMERNHNSTKVSQPKKIKEVYAVTYFIIYTSLYRCCIFYQDLLLSRFAPMKNNYQSTNDMTLQLWVVLMLFYFFILALASFFLFVFFYFIKKKRQIQIEYIT